jgi:hypothetical protein
MTIEKVINLMGSMATNSGQLEDVDYFYWDDIRIFTVIIKLVFQHETFFILANGDDSLELTRKFPNLPSLEELTMTRGSEMVPWRFAIGRHLRWGWMMINQQGYFDGIQLEFGNGDKEESISIQLIAIASSLKIQTVETW